ncbi:hypothetical protein TNCV_2569061 [Trichonephila clavipes]|nr:hypothetical protein TNCV_2569061 [Trichonephila clavipes]
MCKIVNGRPRHPASQGSVEGSNQDVKAMLRIRRIDNNTENWAIDDLYLLLNQQDHYITSTPEDLPVISLKDNNDASKYLLAPELIDYNVSTSKELPASELIDCNASTSIDLLAPELIYYKAPISYGLSMVKSTNNNTSVSYNLPAADLLTKKALDLEDLQTIKSFSLSTTLQLETFNNSTSTAASTVKTSVVLLASEWKAAVSDSKAYCHVCGMESTEAHSCDICKNQVNAICGNTVGEEGHGSKNSMLWDLTNPLLTTGKRPQRDVNMLLLLFPIPLEQESIHQVYLTFPRNSVPHQVLLFIQLSQGNALGGACNPYRAWCRLYGIVVSDADCCTAGPGLRDCKARPKPLRTEFQRKRRLTRAREHSLWTMCQFFISGNQSSAYVRRRTHEEFSPQCLKPTVMYPIKVMVWGCMSSHGVGRLHIVSGTEGHGLP